MVKHRRYDVKGESKGAAMASKPFAVQFPEPHVAADGAPSGD